MRAFRYYRNKLDMNKKRPIVSFRKRIIEGAVPYQLNKASYLKRGSHVARIGSEDNLFDNVFEIVLNEHYENHY